MANFRIKVEALNPEMKVAEDLRNGLECDGFFMGLDRGDIDTSSIHNLSPVDMAIMIAKHTDLLEAAMIAHGMEEAQLMKKNREREMPKVPDLLAALLKQ